MSKSREHSAVNGYTVYISSGTGIDCLRHHKRCMFPPRLGEVLDATSRPRTDLWVANREKKDKENVEPCFSQCILTVSSKSTSLRAPAVEEVSAVVGDL